jgi:hypothetical protein
MASTAHRCSCFAPMEPLAQISPLPTSICGLLPVRPSTSASQRMALASHASNPIRHRIPAILPRLLAIPNRLAMLRLQSWQAISLPALEVLPQFLYRELLFRCCGLPVCINTFDSTGLSRLPSILVSHRSPHWPRTSTSEIE